MRSEVQGYVFLVGQGLSDRRPERNLSGLSNFTFPRKWFDHEGYPFSGKVAITRYSREQLGWEGIFAEAMAPFSRQGLVPVRVIAEHRGLSRVSGTAGEMPAEVTGRIMFHAQERPDYPVVDDWVATAVLDRGERAVIHRILPRAGVLARKHAGRKIEGQAIAANIGIISIVIGLDRSFNLNRVERYLAIASGSGALPIVTCPRTTLLSTGRKTQQRCAAGRTTQG